MQRMRGAVRQVGAVGLVLVTLVVGLGIAATWHAASSTATRGRAQAVAAVDRQAALSEAAVNTEIRRNLNALRTVAAAVGGYERFTAEHFAAATASLPDAGLVGASSILFAVPAADHQLTATEAYWRGLGAADLHLQARGIGREHIFTIYTRPLDGQPTPAPGTDVSQSAEPTAALNESRRSGTASVSDAYVLLRDRDLPAERQQLSFILSSPVYSLPDARGYREFRGWILMGLRGQDFVGGALREATQGLVGASLWAASGNGQNVRIAHLDEQQTGDQQHTNDLRREATIRVANREWKLRITASSKALNGTTSSLPLTVGLGGSALTLLLAGLLWVLAGGRARAEERVRIATAELCQAERTARRQVGLLNGILERISDGVGVVDERGAFLVHNPAAKAMLGVDHDVAGPEGWQQHYGIFRPDGVRPFPVEELPLVRAMAGEATDDVEMVIRNAGRPEGVLLSVSGRPLEVDGQRGAIAVFHDITAVRDREADLTAFAGIVAHDLKNPLTAIAAHAEMVTESLQSMPDEPDAQHARESAQRISAGVIRMRRLIDDLLAYTTSRDAQLRIRSVDLAALVDDVVAERINHLPLRPDVYVGPLPHVDADPGMLRQVLDNLVGNALKYVPPGRTPKIDVSAAPAQPGWVRVEVADRGIGVPDEEKPRIFDSFHRAHESAAYGGTGLGLAICRRIIDRHGGVIMVTDNPGGGSRFSFTLPASVAPVSPAVPLDVVDHEYV